MIHLREVLFNKTQKAKSCFPFNLSVLENLSAMKFTTPATMFVGENGTGKSSLLEALAIAAGSIAIGTEDVTRDVTLSSVHPLAERMKLVWNKRTRRGFFLRAEDFFGYIKRNRATRKSLADEVAKIEIEFKDRSDYARTLAKTPIEASLKALDSRYGGDLGRFSHGESFLALFQSRFVPEGLYLLDEPEAALSPLSQLGVISMIKSMVEQGGQFIIATHSPILMAIPGSQLLNFDFSPPQPMEYDAVEHVKLYRSFLDSLDAYTSKL